MSLRQPWFLVMVPKAAARRNDFWIGYETKLPCWGGRVTPGHAREPHTIGGIRYRLVRRHTLDLDSGLRLGRVFGGIFGAGDGAGGRRRDRELRSSGLRPDGPTESGISRDSRGGNAGQAGEHLVADGPQAPPSSSTPTAADHGREFTAPRRPGPARRSRRPPEVHGDAPDDRATLAGDDHLRRRLALGRGSRAQIAVAVAAAMIATGWPRRRPARAGAHGVAFLDLAYLGDPALELDRRTHGILLPGDRVAAVKRDARPHQVAMGRAAEENPG